MAETLLHGAKTALGYSKEGRDMLGGWSAQGSDRFSRVAKHRISSMQGETVRTSHNRVNNDPLAELGGLEEFAAVMADLGVDFEETRRSVASLSVRRFAEGAREQEMLIPGTRNQCLAEERIADEEGGGELVLQLAESKFRQRSWPGTN